MPTTKTGQIKSESHFHNAVKYILNPDKTNEQVLTSGYQIQNINNAENAWAAFNLAKEVYSKDQ